MIDSTKHLSLCEFESLGTNKNGVYHFDLSAIDIDYFDAFFLSVYLFGKSGPIRGLAFNADLSLQTEIDRIMYKKSRNALIKQFHPKIEWESSIYKNREKVIRPELAGLISRFLPKSESLRVLKFRNIPFSKRDVEVLSQSIMGNTSLRELTFTNVPLTDDGFRVLASSLKKKGILKLKCRNCKLTDDIGGTVLSLIQLHSNIQKEAEKKAEMEKNPNLGIVCLNSFDFRDNNLTTEFLHNIEHEVEFSPITFFDLRSNIGIPESDVISNKIYTGESTSSLSISGFPKSPEAKILAKTQRKAKSKSRNDVNSVSRDIVLEAENRNLKMTLDNLLGGQNVAILMDDLFAVGERAPELAEHVQKLDEFCERLENDQFYHRTVSSQIQYQNHKLKSARRKKMAQNDQILNNVVSDVQDNPTHETMTKLTSSNFPYPRKTSAYNKK